MTTFCAFSHHHLPTSTFFLKFQCQSLWQSVFPCFCFCSFSTRVVSWDDVKKSSFTVWFCLFFATWWEWEIFVEISCGILKRFLREINSTFHESRSPPFLCVCVFVFEHFFTSEMKWQSYNDFFASTFNKSRNAKRSTFFGRYDKLWATIMWWEAPNERKKPIKIEERT